MTDLQWKKKQNFTCSDDVKQHLSFALKKYLTQKLNLRIDFCFSSNYTASPMNSVSHNFLPHTLAHKIKTKNKNTAKRGTNCSMIRGYSIKLLNKMLKSHFWCGKKHFFNRKLQPQHIKHLLKNHPTQMIWLTYFVPFIYVLFFTVLFSCILRDNIT